MRHPSPLLRNPKALFWLHQAFQNIELTRNSLLSLIFPWICPGCRELLPYPQVLCENCADSLKKIIQPFCNRCGNPFPIYWQVTICSECKLQKSSVTRIRSVYYYEDLVKAMIRDAKFAKKARMLKYFAEEMYKLARREFPSKIGALVPVPMHRSREWDRTFNQAERLAAVMSEYWGIPVWRALRKVGKTLPQSSLSEGARRRNLKGAFLCKSVDSVPRSVLLIDDVLTTGTTLQECARTLRKAGVHRVYGITIARAVKLF
jgi:ComF family protein